MSEQDQQNYIRLRPIGVIRSPYKEKAEAPFQGAAKPEGTGTVEVFPEYTEGLKEIEGFSHIILIYYFDRASEVQLVRPTFLDDTPHGVFASRSPCRPSGIGLSIVRLIERDGNRLTVAEIDMLDGTPLLDIKPYVPWFDCRPEASSGWLEDKQAREKPPGRE